MKKLLIMMVVAVAAIASNAASFKWTSGNMYASNGTDKWTGAVSLYGYLATADASTAILVDTGTASAAGTIANRAFEWASAEADKGYSFYYVIEDSGKVFTSATIANVIVQESAAATIGFGNQATATQNASNWASSGGGEPVPEPTSGLLMLIGAAGLALRRKRA